MQFHYTAGLKIGGHFILCRTPAQKWGHVPAPVSCTRFWKTPNCDFYAPGSGLLA